jgi:GntR family transcriptional regulator/MocR family aminotransferase
MAPRSQQAPHSLSPVRLERAGPVPLHRQIVELLRSDVLEGTLSPGQRLAATRVLAEDLGVSRNTVCEAYDQLTAEGYLVSRTGSGTFVAEDLPDDLLRPDGPTAARDRRRSPPLSRRGSRLLERSAPLVRTGVPFEMGRPALDLFPWTTWSRLLARRARNLPRELLDYQDPAGYRPLRELLAHHLLTKRGVECSPDQILVVRGSQQGLDLAARVLLDRGDPVWIEDPGYPAARAAFAAGGALEVPVPVDDQGLDVERGLDLAPDARLAYVTPSHQYPLGVTLSLARRLELLRWARETDAWIIEDDYDSAYRFAGRPLASLTGLDGARNVVYVGTFSKVLFPALRLGYLVLPRERVDAFVAARTASDRCPGILEQAVLAEFIAEGHFHRHVVRMRTVYARRQEALGRALATRLGRHLELRPSPAGLHDLAWLRRRAEDDERIAQRALAAGVQVAALSGFCRQVRLRPGLLFGYAGFPSEMLTAAVERLATVVEN